MLTGAEVTRLLPMDRCIAAMAEVLAGLAAGRATQPLRTVIRLPAGAPVGHRLEHVAQTGDFTVMPAVVDAPAAFGLKAITVFPGNEGTRYQSHQGAVLLFEAEHGTLVSVMDAAALTAIRTAAVSAVATRLLSNPGPADLALLGTGVQARTHLEAIRAVRSIRRVRAWSRNPTAGRAFAEWALARFGIDVDVPESPRETVAQASVICTLTSARTPILENSWVADGAHINAVGASTPDARELDGALVARARLFADRRESLLNEAGDFLMARTEGLITDADCLGELGDLVLGRVAGRITAGDVTLFKSLGLAVEDVAAAQVVHSEAERQGVGTVVELGGMRED